MNEHPLYSRSGETSAPSSGAGSHSTGQQQQQQSQGQARLANLMPAGVSNSPTQNNAFQQSSFYTHAPTSFHQSASVFTSDRNALNPMLSSTCSTDSVMSHHGGGGVNGSVAGSRIGGLDSPSTSLLRHSGKEHPAVQQAEQMNDFMDAFFNDHEASTSHDPILSKEANPGIDVDLAATERIYEVVPPPQQPPANTPRKRGRKPKNHSAELEALLRSNEDIGDDMFPVRSGSRSIATRDEYTRAKRAEAARSRYQRMTEQERRIYNNRRRMRALGLDPDDPTKVDHDKVRMNLMYNNAKKAEAARLRYHRMSLEEKKAYNQRRTEAFRKRRQEQKLQEEELLSTPAGRISNEALAKAQQIMIRNAKKAEAARQRYQRLTPEERREYNQKRAIAKKIRQRMARGEADTPDILSSNASIASGDLSESFTSNPDSLIIDSIVEQVASDSGVRTVANQRAQRQLSAQQTLLEQTEQALRDHEEYERHQQEIIREMKEGEMMSVLPKAGGIDRREPEDDDHFIDVAGLEETNEEPHPATSTFIDENDEIFHRLERDVLKRTREAKQALARQKRQQMSTASIAEQLQEMTKQDGLVLTSDGHIMSSTGDQVFVQPVQQQYIDEKALLNMLLTGVDQSGCPIEIRLPDGTLINTEAQLKESMSSGQTIMIHQLSTEPSDKVGGHLIDVDDSRSGRTSVGEGVYSMSETHHVRGTRTQTIDLSQKKMLIKARRAERARLRYHTMDPEIKQQQNAKRAEMLRKSRARDEELCQMAETCDIMELDEETRNAIISAQTRRAKRAAQARQKYHRMDSEERRQYNAMRDAQRRQRKREQEARQMLQITHNKPGRPPKNSNQSSSNNANNSGAQNQSSSVEEVAPSDSLTPPSANTPSGGNDGGDSQGQQMFNSFDMYSDSIY